MEDKECSQLLIIGNGFDLCCKLKSAYADFYKQHFDSEIIKIFRSKNITPTFDEDKNYVGKYDLLELILLDTYSEDESGKIFWKDIESTIAESVNFDKHSYLYKILHNSTDAKIWFMIQMLQEIHGDESLQSEKSIINIFKTSVHKLERKFMKYIKAQTTNDDPSSDSDYKVNTEKLYNYLTDNEWSETYVINFNYTYLSKTDRKKFYEYKNVHGRYCDDIILGIDTSSISDKNIEFLDLSKTYRKMILDAQSNSETKSLPKNVKSIKFFGHSLAKADYAYFRSIFDFYNIYDSNVDIIFYYYNFDDNLNILENQVESVYSLLNNYGKSFSGELEKKGDNLVHKLSLEGRLKIKEMEVNYLNSSRIANIKHKRYF
ncbi:AbiH family protein [Enterococcus faecalis]|uniref:AbiH family protein n=1 Tax=Enterococcus faecalis TaxID=1351 RepID=UPI003CC64F87